MNNINKIIPTNEMFIRTTVELLFENNDQDNSAYEVAIKAAETKYGINDNDLRKICRI